MNSKRTKATLCTSCGKRGISRASADRKVCARAAWRYIIVLRGTWYTDEGEVFRPKATVPLKPGDFMRHPKDGPHYDGALDEDTWVAISGYGPTKATVIDGGELFGKSR